VVTRDGVPVVSHTLRSDLLGPPGAPESNGGQETRVVVTLLAVGPGAGEVRPAVAGRRAAVLPLAAAGAVLTTATGADLPTARAELSALTGAAIYA
jgi:hypothetical protein